jgi:hypothetical protein
LANLFGWGARKDNGAEAVAAPAPPAEQVCASIVLPKFFNALSNVAAPTILDLGPVVGANVAFFGDRLGCKLLIGDLQRDLEADGVTPDEARDRILARLKTTIVGPVNGVLCWDVFDFLNRPTAQALGAFLTGVLAPGGVVHGFFGTTQGELTYHTRFVLQTASSLSCRRVPAKPVKRTVLQTRDLTTMFGGLTVVDSVLLKTQQRETLLRKS